MLTLAPSFKGVSVPLAPTNRPLYLNHRHHWSPFSYHCHFVSQRSPMMCIYNVDTCHYDDDHIVKAATSLVQNSATETIDVTKLSETTPHLIEYVSTYLKDHDQPCTLFLTIWVLTPSHSESNNIHPIYFKWRKILSICARFEENCWTNFEARGGIFFVSQFSMLFMSQNFDFLFLENFQRPFKEDPCQILINFSKIGPVQFF